MPALIETRAAWHFVKEWAADTLSFPDLEKELSNLGTYCYSDWSKIFKRVEVASDPTEEHLVSAVDIVLEAARNRGITLSGDESTSESSFPVASDSEPASELRRSRKRRKLAINKYLDLDAAEDDDEDEIEEESENGPDEIRDTSHPRRMEQLGCQVFAKKVDDIANRYTAGGPRSSPEKEKSTLRCYYVNFLSQYIARYILEDLKPHVVAALVIPWLPRRLYVRASSPLEIRRAVNPSHRDLVRNIILVPEAEATQIFSTNPPLPTRSWVRIKKGKYRNDLGYVLSCDGDTANILVVPRERPYDLPNERSRNIRALFDWQTAYEAGLDLTLLANSRNITAFQYNGTSYFTGLLRLSLMPANLEQVLLPDLDELFLFAQAGIDSSLVQESCILFSSQFWIEGDVVRSSSPELLDKNATIISVEFGQGTVSLLLDGQTYHCPIIEQRRIFSLGDHVRIIAGPNRGLSGQVITVIEDKVVLTSSSDLTREVQVSNFYLETCRPDHKWLSHDPAVHLLHPPEPEQAALQLGDTARVVDGPHTGVRGYVDWITDDLVWILIPLDPKDDQPDDPGFWGLNAESVCVPISKIVPTSAPNVIKFTKEKGYNVGVGDTVRVARGPYWGRQGVVRVVRWNEVHLEVLFQDGSLATVPMTSCVKLTDFSMREASRSVGKEVWVVGGEFRGRRATLDRLGRDQCVISMFGHPSLSIPNRHIASPSGVLLTGQMLDQKNLQQLVQLIRRSFTTQVTRSREKTPPPSPRASSSALPSELEGSAWVVTASDVPTPAQPSDHGEISWIFNDAFCQFTSFHLAFNVDLRYMNGSFINRVARTTCPDRFRGAPEGHVSVTVPGHNKGAGIGHHFILAKFLKPALPTGSGKNRFALILVGDDAGQIHPITTYRKKKREVQLGGSWFACKDICPAYPFDPNQ